LIRLDGVFRSLSGEITQLRPDHTASAVRGNLTINRALKIAELDPSNDPSLASGHLSALQAI